MNVARKPSLQEFFESFGRVRVSVAALAGCQSTSMEGTASMAPLGYPLPIFRN